MVTILAWRCFMHRSRVEDKGTLLNIHFGLMPLISLLAGILILVMPKLLNYIVAFYLIAIGLIGLLGIHQLHLG
jgi:hypothetical protein